MNFDNKVLAVAHIFGIDIWITETIINSWIIIILLTMFSLFVNLSINKFHTVPKGIQNFIELAIEAIDKMTATNMGDRYLFFSPWFFGVFTFLICSNLSGLFGLRPPTADLATTFMFSVVTFCLIHFMGIYTNWKSYFKGYVQPMPFMLPINVIGELATPVSLGFRLFGNILGGFIIMGMVYNLPIVLKLGTPGVLHIYFDVFSGVLQSFIFVILSMTFIGDKIFD